MKKPSYKTLVKRDLEQREQFDRMREAVEHVLFDLEARQKQLYNKEIEVAQRLNWGFFRRLKFLVFNR